MKIEYAIRLNGRFYTVYELQCWVIMGRKLFSTGVVIYTRISSARRGVKRFTEQIEKESGCDVELIEI